MIWTPIQVVFWWKAYSAFLLGAYIYVWSRRNASSPELLQFSKMVLSDRKLNVVLLYTMVLVQIASLHFAKRETLELPELYVVWF